MFITRPRALPFRITVEWEDNGEWKGATAVLELDGGGAPIIESDALSAESMQFLVALSQVLVDGTA